MYRTLAFYGQFLLGRPLLRTIFFIHDATRPFLRTTIFTGDLIYRRRFFTNDDIYVNEFLHTIFLTVFFQTIIFTVFLQIMRFFINDNLLFFYRQYFWPIFFIEVCFYGQLFLQMIFFIDETRDARNGALEVGC